ncbi:hypothetical protein BSKO_02471 [Bryopsis sp. KO-2023]|nr:hypothetical protein BSKO_02471 [Bryopsis sp. KO-2023]
MVSKIALVSACALGSLGLAVGSWWIWRQRRRGYLQPCVPPLPRAELAASRSDSANESIAIVKYVAPPDEVVEGFWIEGNSPRAIAMFFGAATLVFIDNHEMMVSRGGLMGGVLGRDLGTGVFLFPDHIFRDMGTLQELLQTMQGLVQHGAEVPRIVDFVDAFVRGHGVLPPPGFGSPWIFRRLGELV